MGEIGEFWRDVKAHKKEVKRQQEENPPRRRCYDWMVVSGSCHYAKNRSSFSEYRRIDATAAGMAVIGIGTVQLQVVRSPTEPESHTIVLQNVLHIPTARSNGFCSRLVGGSEQWEGGKEGLIVKGFDASKRPDWYALEFCGLGRVVLAGNPQGETFLDNSPMMLSLYLTDDEHRILFQ